MQIITRKQAKEQGLKTYFTGKPCKNGHLAEKYTNNRLCLLCLASSRSKSLAARKADGRFAAQLARQGQKDKERRAVDPSYVAARTAHCRKWRSKNADRVAKWCHEVRYKDPQYIAKNRLTTRLHSVLKLKGKRVSGSLESAVGCSGQFLVQWLESQFCEGMSWECGAQVHVDHVRPCASFDLTNPDQLSTCFNWRNLRPVWDKENLSKKDRWTPETETAWAQRMTELGWENELFPVFGKAIAA